MIARQTSEDGSTKTFVYHRLMDSVRTPRGPRQRILLNLGKLDLPRSDWKTLANRIEGILLGQESFFTPAPRIESLAQHYAQLLTNDKWERIHIRLTLDPELFHYEIHRALGLPPKPLRKKRLTV